MKVLSVKKKRLNCYDVFNELELDNGEYIMFNEYYGVEEHKPGDTIDLDAICIFKESVIDKADDDTFWEHVDEYLVSDIKKLENVEVYNEYIRVILSV